MRILIAEDETIIRLDLRALLEKAGFEVCAEAKDGEEAVTLARTVEPDLALLDVKMPKLDGIDAARRILEERPIPIVMVTAYGEQELVSRAVEAGVFGYLVKPFRENDLLPAIATARARHDELAAVREEADSLSEALAARKAIERAKGLLMEREGLTEQDAFARLRKASQISGRPLKVVAEALIATLDVKAAKSEDAVRSLRCREKLRVLPLAEAAPAEPDEQRQQRERADDHERIEDERRLGDEDLAGPVERLVPARRHRHDGRRLATSAASAGSWRTVASPLTWARVVRTRASSARAASRRASRVARVSASRSVPARRAERRAICPRSAVSRFVSSST